VEGKAEMRRYSQPYSQYFQRPHPRKDTCDRGRSLACDGYISPKLYVLGQHLSPSPMQERLRTAFRKCEQETTQEESTDE
jgi:hypothetical protein